MHFPRSSAALVLVAIVFLAGCSSKGKNASTLPEDVLAPPPEVDASTGAIHGVVTDESSVILSGVKVGIVELKVETMSDNNGQFTFSKLQPGPLRISAHKLGYKDWLRHVEVQAGEVSNVNVQLVEIPVEDGRPRSEVTSYNGRIVCGTSVGGYFPLVTAGYTSVECGDPGYPITSNPNQKFLFTYNVTKESTGQLWEQSWKPTQVLSRELLIIVEKDCGDEGCAPADRFAQSQGCCYIRVALNDTQMDLPGVKAGTNGATVRTRTFPAFGSSAHPETLVGLFTDQMFTIYWEQFWGPLPENFRTDRTNVPPS